MARERWKLAEVESDLRPVFTAARNSSPEPQLVVAEDGVYEISFVPKGRGGSAQEFLTNGGIEDS